MACDLKRVISGEPPRRDFEGNRDRFLQGLAEENAHIETILVTAGGRKRWKHTITYTNDKFDQIFE